MFQRHAKAIPRPAIQPAVRCSAAEGAGWELFAIASVVVGGTLLSGGDGSVGATLAVAFGVILVRLKQDKG